MSFTETQKLKICRIFAPDLSSVQLDYVLTLYATEITAEVESQVGDLIDEYFTGTTSRNITRINPNDKNFGAEKDPEHLRAIIRKELASLLYLTDLVNQGSRLVRC